MKHKYNLTCDHFSQLEIAPTSQSFLYAYSEFDTSTVSQHLWNIPHKQAQW